MANYYYVSSSKHYLKVGNIISRWKILHHFSLKLRGNNCFWPSEFLAKKIMFTSKFTCQHVSSAVVSLRGDLSYDFLASLWIGIFHHTARRQSLAPWYDCTYVPTNQSY